MEKKLKTLFDYQRFEKNERLEKLICETESRYAKGLSDDDLSLVNAAGEVVTGGTDVDTRKDLYENIILGVSPEEHNIMLNNAPEGEMKVKCPYCFLMVSISKIDAHKAVCSKRSDERSGWIG